MIDNAPSGDWADPFNQTTAQVFFNASEGSGFGFSVLGNLELFAIFRMIAPLAGEVQRLSGLNVGEAASHCYRFGIARDFEAGHRIARLSGMKGQPLDNALQVLGWLFAHAFGCLRSLMR